MTENTYSKKYPYQTIYDQYWNSFYCKKNMSMDTDLTKIDLCKVKKNNLFHY